MTDVGTDTPPSTTAATCRSNMANTNAGNVGGTSGSMRMPELCGADEIAVSFLADMTNGPNWNNRYAVARATLGCARVARAAGGSYQNTAGRQIVANDDPCNPFNAPVSTALTTCPAGSVIVGLRTAPIPGQSGGPATCFSNLTVICAAIGADGKPGAVTSRLRIDNTFNQNLNLNETDVVCPAGQALRGVRPNDGCGLDGLQLLCGPVLCD